MRAFEIALKFVQCADPALLVTLGKLLVWQTLVSQRQFGACGNVTQLYRDHGDGTGVWSKGSNCTSWAMVQSGAI